MSTTSPVAPGSRGRLGAGAVLVLVLGLLLATLQVVLAPESQARGRNPETRIISRDVVMRLRNTNTTAVACTADEEVYSVRVRVIGQRRDVYGRGGVAYAHVMSHDIGTGGWFWTMPEHRRLNYARGLVRPGHISMVVSRLGYAGSKLRNGDDTCLGAQASMLHQVVQAARSGAYRYVNDRHGSPAASFVTVHGHGQGALIAEIEAAEYDDVDGLVLLGWADCPPTLGPLGTCRNRTARDRAESTREANQCTGPRTYATYGAGRKAYNKLLFSSARRSVRTVAARLRHRVPCGDVESLAAAEAYLQDNLDAIEAHVLLVYGKRDSRIVRDAYKRQRRQYDSAKSVRVALVRRQGSALPIERAGAELQRFVKRWDRNHVG